MKKILNIFLVGILVTGLSSCLKDKTIIGPDSPGAIKNIIEFSNIGEITSGVSSIYPVYAQSYDVAAPGKLTVTVSYAGVDNAPSDINVAVAMDPSILTVFNAKNVKDARDQAIELGQDPDEAEDEVDLIALLKPASYTLPNLNLVIPKGQKTVSFDVVLKPNLFTFDEIYALPFKITSASVGTISGNFSTMIVKISGRNRLDGVYNLKTSATTSLRPGLNENGVKLATSGANSVSYPLLNYYTLNIVTVSVDPVTNVATVTDSSLGVPAIMDPISKYDPATKVLRLKWTAGTRSFDETFTYTGARP